MELALPLAFILILCGIYAFRKTRSKKQEQFPKHWHVLLIAHVHFYKELPTTEQERFQQRVMTFLSETYVEGVGFLS